MVFKQFCIRTKNYSSGKNRQKRQKQENMFFCFHNNAVYPGACALFYQRFNISAIICYIIIASNNPRNKYQNCPYKRKGFYSLGCLFFGIQKLYKYQQKGKYCQNSYYCVCCDQQVNHCNPPFMPTHREYWIYILYMKKVRLKLKEQHSLARTKAL